MGLHIRGQSTGNNEKFSFREWHGSTEITATWPLIHMEILSTPRILFDSIIHIMILIQHVPPSQCSLHSRNGWGNLSVKLMNIP